MPVDEHQHVRIVHPADLDRHLAPGAGVWPGAGAAGEGAGEGGDTSDIVC